jgi:hypothetical protein
MDEARKGELSGESESIEAQANARSQRVSTAQNQIERSRRESNPHLRFRKPPFYPLNYGNNGIFDFRFSIADCKRWPRHLHRFLRYTRNAPLTFDALDESSQQRNKPAAAGDFEFAEDRVKVLFHHRQA